MTDRTDERYIRLHLVIRRLLRRCILIKHFRYQTLVLRLIALPRYQTLVTQDAH